MEEGQLGLGFWEHGRRGLARFWRWSLQEEGDKVGSGCRRERERELRSGNRSGGGSGVRRAGLAASALVGYGLGDWACWPSA